MAGRAGIAAQFGIAAETTWGTRAAPDHFYEFVKEGLKLDQDWIKSKALTTRRVQRSNRTVRNKKGADGDVSLEHANKGMGLLWKHMLGAVAITTPGGAT